MSFREAFRERLAAGLCGQLAELSLATAGRVREAQQALADRTATRSHVVTEGQAYVLHLLAVLVDEQPDPPDVDVLAWRAGRLDSQQLALARDRGTIRRLRYVLDPHGFKVSWQSAAHVRRGGNRRALHANHAKVYLVHRAGRGAVVLSSGNLNANRRIEQHLVDRSPAAVAFWAGTFDQLVAGGDPFEAGEHRKVANT